MKSLKLYGVLLLSLVYSLNSLADIITNGDFASCDYSGWETRTDGGVGSPNDFSIINNAGECSAQLQVDHMSPAGDPFGSFVNDAFLANTLSQALDFTGAASSTWLLTIDYSVTSESSSSDPFFLPDNFFFAIHDNNGNYVNENENAGNLLGSQAIDGVFADIFVIELSNSFSNDLGWFLDMQLNLGADSGGFTDGFGSSLIINSVSLIEQLASIPELPEPSVAVLMLAILVTFVRYQKINK